MKSIRNKITDLNTSTVLLLWVVVFLMIFSTLLIYNHLDVLISILGVAVVILFFNNLTYLSFLLIFLVPLSINQQLGSGIQLSLPAEGLLLLFTAILSLKIIVEQKIKLPIKHPVSILLLLDLGWTVVVTLTSELPLVSTKRLLIKTLFIACYFYIIPALLKNDNQYKKLFVLYGIGIIIPIFYASYKHSLLGLSQENSIQTSLPFFDEHTIYGASIAFLLPFFAISTFQTKKYRIETLLVLITLLIGLYLSFSRAAWLSLLVSVSIYLIIQFRITLKTVSILFVLFIGIVAFNFSYIYQKLQNTNTKYGDEVTTHIASITNLKNDASNLERVNRWVSAYRLFEDKPLTGYGPGTYQFVYDKFQTTQYMTRISTNVGNRGNAHSEYLTLLSESGLIGLLLFLSIIIASYFYTFKILGSNATKNLKQITIISILGLTTFFIHGLFNSFIDSNKMAVLVYGSLGILANISFESSKIKDF